MNKNLPRNASLLTFLNYIFHLFIVWPFFWLISLVFSFFIKIRVGLYRLGVFKTHRFKTPIISIGNIEFGGTGKTPMVIYISKKLTKKNIKHVVVSRGYKKNKPGVVVVSNYKQILNHSADDCGDEPILLASKLRCIPVVVSEQKAQAIQFSIEEFKPDIILLDDGFQSLGLHRDLDIVLLNVSTFLAGNFFLFPLGFLRDSVASLKGADFLVCTKFDAVLDVRRPAYDKYSNLVMDRNSAFDWVSRFKKRINGSPYYQSEYKVVFFLHSWETNTLMSASTAFPLDKKGLNKNSFIAFSGIGDSSSFHRAVKQGLGFSARFIDLDNHFNYLKNAKLLKKKLAPAIQEQGFVLITTFKDYVKLIALFDLEEYSFLFKSRPSFVVLDVEHQIHNFNDIEKSILSLVEK